MIPAPTITSSAGFWGVISDQYALSANKPGFQASISRALGRSAFRGNREILRTLLGAATGNAASDTYKRAEAPVGLTASQQLGGSRTIETVTVVSRNTTAADLTYMQAMTDRFFIAPITYVADLAGNGGGGKAGV